MKIFVKINISRMAKPTVEKSDYLQTIGIGLHRDIDMF
jgi:hypothetical protein